MKYLRAWLTTLALSVIAGGAFAVPSVNTWVFSTLSKATYVYSMTAHGTMDPYLNIEWRAEGYFGGSHADEYSDLSGHTLRVQDPANGGVFITQRGLATGTWGPANESMQSNLSLGCWWYCVALHPGSNWNPPAVTVGDDQVTCEHFSQTLCPPPPGYCP